MKTQINGLSFNFLEQISNLTPQLLAVVCNVFHEKVVNIYYQKFIFASFLSVRVGGLFMMARGENGPVTSSSEPGDIVNKPPGRLIQLSSSHSRVMPSVVSLLLFK